MNKNKRKVNTVLSKYLLLSSKITLFTFIIIISASFVLADAPVSDDQFVSIDEDTSVIITLTGSDVDGDPLTFSIVSDPTQGIITDFDLITGTLTYTPGQDYSGPDSFTFNTYDDIDLSNTATVSITVLPKVVYVDDDFSEEFSEDHIFGLDAFSTIQEGVDNVAEGGTVDVAAGTYDGSLTINKPLSLIGPGIDVAPATISADCDYVLTIAASDVNVQGLYFSQNDEFGEYCYSYPVIRVNGFYDPDLGQDVDVTNVTITENDIAGGYRGINLRYDSLRSTINNNIIHDNNAGIKIGSSKDNTISGNDIYTNDNGIQFEGGGGDGDVSGNALTSNNIHDNTNYGVSIYDVTFNELNITNNNITNNGVEESYFGIYLYNIGESHLKINSNNISENTGTGISFDSYATNVEVTNNNINNNGDKGIYFDQIANSADWLVIGSNEIRDNDDVGIYLDYITNSNVNISKNDITGNGRLDGEYYGEVYGIYIYSADETSQVEIDSNNISENSGPGIYLDQGEGTGVTNVDIINNYLMDNNKFEYTYWDIEPASIIILYALGNRAHLNTILTNASNVVYGVALNNEDETNTFDAENNYWDSASPNFSSIILGDVSYAPWYIDTALTMLISTQIEENETLADDMQEMIDENVTQVRVPIGSPIEELIVDSDNQVNISLAELIDLTGDVELVNDFTLIRQTSTVNYTAEIPAGTIISGGSDWDGKINMPTPMDAASYSAPSGTVDVVIDVGSGSEINFSNPVKITIGGKAGKKAAWARGTSTLTEITTVCDSSTNPTNINAVSPRECYIDSGSDLIIWTYHFTQFAAYTLPVQSSTESSGGGGGGNSENLENLGPIAPEVITPVEEPKTIEEETEETTVPVPTPAVVSTTPTGFAALTGNIIATITTPGGAIVAIVGVILVALALYSGYSYLFKKK